MEIACLRAIETPQGADELGYAWLGDGVVDKIGLLIGAHQALMLKPLKVLGDVGVRCCQLFVDLADSLWAIDQPTENLQADRVRECFHDVRQSLHRAVLHICPL